MRFSPAFVSLLILASLAACSGDEETKPDASSPDTSVPDAFVPLDDAGIVSGSVILSTDTLDFGAVVVTSTGTMMLTITNPEDEPVQVTLSEPFGPNAALFTRTLNIPDEQGTFVIEPNGVVTLTVTVSPRELGPALAVLALDSCRGTCPSAIVLQAVGVETGIVCPENVDFGLLNPGACSAFRVVCENRGNAMERVTVAELEPTSSPAFELAPPALPVELTPGGTLSLDVEYCPTAVSRDEGQLRVRTFRPFQTQHLVRLLGAGGGADVTCTPDQVSFGTVGLGATITQSVSCRNNGAEPAMLGATLATGTNFGIAALPMAPVPPNGTGVFRVTATPQAVGLLTDTLQITTNDPDSPRIDIALSADAIMADPCTATLLPPSRDLGLVGIGDVRRTTFTITNTGATVCLFRDASFQASTPAFTVSSAPAPGTSLAAGASFDVVVDFAPMFNAVASATLVVAFSNPGTTELTAMATGTGGLAPVRITPEIVDFGAAPLGCGAPSTIQLSLDRLNTGSGPVTTATIQNESMAGVFAVNHHGALPATIELGERVSFDIEFTPPATGVYTAEVHILAGGLPTPLIVPIRGEGSASTMRTETFDFEVPRIDILFVIENTDATGGIQTELAQRINVFADALAARAADFHFGVITTDDEDAAHSGRLVGMPTYFDNATPNLPMALAQRVQVGVDGSDSPAAFTTLQAALTPPLSTAENAGFRRADADLAVLFVGAEDESSPAAPAISQRVLDLRSLVTGQRLYVGALVGPPNEPCVGQFGAAEAGSRYAQFSLRAGGNVFSVCGSFEDNLRTLAGEILGAPSFSLGLEPRFSTIAVEIDAQPAAGWVFDLARRSVTFPGSNPVPPGATVSITYEPFCLSTTCLDGVPQPNEECDDGDQDDLDECTTRCLNARCGDGLPTATLEACDDGNLDNGDACVSSCQAAICGDGYLQRGVETCDDNNTTPGDGCPSTCRYYAVTPLSGQPYTPLGLPTAITFTDASGGDPLDDGTALVTLPFTFYYFESPITEVTVSVNGFIGVGLVDPATSYDNVSFPDALEPNGIIAVWWEDLYLDAAITDGASVAYETIGIAPLRTFIVEWRDLRRTDHTTNNHRRFTFQVRLEEATSAIRFRYEESETTGNPPTATSASAGIEDLGGSVGFEALGCSPGCAGPPRPQNPIGFPEQSEVIFSP